MELIIGNKKLPFIDFYYKSLYLRSVDKVLYYNHCIEEKLYLNDSVMQNFNWISGNKRFLWNELVREDEKRQKSKEKIMNPKERNSLITKTINANPFFKESKMTRSTATAVYFEYGRAWNAFFKDHKNGKPKLKKAKTSKKSFSINNDRNTLKLQLSPNESNYAYIKIPNFKDKIKFRITSKTIKALANKDELTKITIKESLKGDWYVILHFRRPIEENVIKISPKRVVGIDRNIQETITTSEGDFYCLDIEKLKEISNQISNLDKILAEKRRVKNSNNRKVRKEYRKKGLEIPFFSSSKRYIKVQEKRKKLFRKKTRIIKDFHLKTKKVIIEKQDEPTLFVMEKLNIKNMTKSAKGTKQNPGKNVKQKSGLNRSMLLVSHGAFGNMFKSSIMRDFPQHSIEEVPAHNTSNTCFECKYSDADNRTGYLFHCLSCGHIDHSDINSTYNIANKGIDTLKSQGVQVEHLNAFVLKKTYKNK